MRAFAVFLGLLLGTATPASASVVNIGGVYYGSGVYDENLYATETSVVWWISEGHWAISGTQFLYDAAGLQATRSFNAALDDNLMSGWGIGYQSTTMGNSGNITVQVDFQVLSADSAQFRWVSLTVLGNSFDSIQGTESGPYPYGWKPDCFTSQCYAYPEPPVAAAAVPLPAASLMLAGGLGLMGTVARRKARAP